MYDLFLFIELLKLSFSIRLRKEGAAHNKVIDYEWSHPGPTKLKQKPIADMFLPKVYDGL